MKLNTDEVFVTDRCHAPILVAITSLSPASQPPAADRPKGTAAAGAPEITDEMLAAGEAAFDETYESLPTRGVVQAVYIAMRAAALRATGGGR